MAHPDGVHDARFTTHAHVDDPTGVRQLNEPGTAAVRRVPDEGEARNPRLRCGVADYADRTLLRNKGFRALSMENYSLLPLAGEWIDALRHGVTAQSHTDMSPLG